MDPSENPLRALFTTMATSQHARAVAAGVASTQRAHFEMLVAEGMDRGEALELTARTSLALFEGTARIVEALTGNADKVAKAAETILKSVRPDES